MQNVLVAMFDGCCVLPTALVLKLNSSRDRRTEGPTARRHARALPEIKLTVDLGWIVLDRVNEEYGLRGQEGARA